MTKPPSLAGKHILVVEDEYFIADDLRRALIGAGAEIGGPVSSVNAALDMLHKGRFDAAILDINLGGEMSFSIADQLVSRGIPFLLSTGYDEWVIPPRFAETPRIAKPFNSSKLFHQLAGITTAAA